MRPEICQTILSALQTERAKWLDLQELDEGYYHDKIEACDAAIAYVENMQVWEVTPQRVEAIDFAMQNIAQYDDWDVLRAMLDEVGDGG